MSRVFKQTVRILVLACSLGGLADLTAVPRTVRVGVFPAAPLVQVDHGQPSGLFIDLVEYFAKTLDWQVEYVEASWSQHLGDLEQGKLDLLPAVSFNQARTAIFDFNQHPIFIDSGVLFTNSSFSLHTVFDLQGKQVAAVKGSLFTTGFTAYLASFGVSCQLVLKDDNRQVMEAIADGTVDAGVCIYSLGLVLAREYPVSLSAVSFSPFALHFAVPKGKNADLVAGINRLMPGLLADPGSVYSRSYTKWIMTDHQPSVPAWFWIVIALVLGGLLILWLFVMLLRRQIRLRTHELKQANRQLEAQKLEFSSIFSQSLDGMALIDDKGIRLANPAWLRLFDIDNIDQIIDHQLTEFFRIEAHSPITEGMARLLNSPHQSVLVESAILTKSSQKVHLELHFSTVAATPDARRILVLAHDITSRHNYQKLLEQSERSLKLAQSHAHVGSWTWNIESGKVFWSDEMFRIFGVDKASFTGDLGEIVQSRIHPDDREAVLLSNQAVTEQGQSSPLHYRIIHPDGSIRTVWAQAGELERNYAGQPVLLFGYVQDVTERRAAEEQVKNNLKEKETLLRELYHRTKNNMYLISSLLSLYSDEASDPKLKHAFLDMISRIQSMALVHQKLYQAADLSRIDLADYIPDLVKLICQSFVSEAAKIQFHLRIPPIIIPIETAIPLGLVLNELIINALKYAFPGGRIGSFTVDGSRTEGHLRIILSDDGIGLPASVSNNGHRGLGLTLAYSIIQDQLMGQVTIDSQPDKGCRTTLEIPLHSPAT